MSFYPQITQISQMRSASRYARHGHMLNTSAAPHALHAVLYIVRGCWPRTLSPVVRRIMPNTLAAEITTASTSSETRYATTS